MVEDERSWTDGCRAFPTLPPRANGWPRRVGLPLRQPVSAGPSIRADLLATADMHRPALHRVRRTILLVSAPSRETRRPLPATLLPRRQDHHFRQRAQQQTTTLPSGPIGAHRPAPLLPIIVLSTGVIAAIRGSTPPPRNSIPTREETRRSVRSSGPPLPLCQVFFHCVATTTTERLRLDSRSRSCPPPPASTSLLLLSLIFPLSEWADHHGASGGDDGSCVHDAEVVRRPSRGPGMERSFPRVTGHFLQRAVQVQACAGRGRRQVAVVRWVARGEAAVNSLSWCISAGDRPFKRQRCTWMAPVATQQGNGVAGREGALLRSM